MDLLDDLDQAAQRLHRRANRRRLLGRRKTNDAAPEIRDDDPRIMALRPDAATRSHDRRDHHDSGRGDEIGRTRHALRLVHDPWSQRFGKQSGIERRHGLEFRVNRLAFRPSPGSLRLLHRPCSFRGLQERLWRGFDMAEATVHPAVRLACFRMDAGRQRAGMASGQKLECPRRLAVDHLRRRIGGSSPALLAGDPRCRRNRNVALHFQ